jgi:hypothetical protein
MSPPRATRVSANRHIAQWLAALVAIAAFAVPASTSAADFSTVQYFGYFAARLSLSGGNHLAEVRDRTNMNWVQFSDVDKYRPEVLGGCKPHSCIVSTGNEFFTGCDGAPAPNCNLYPNYRERWLRLADEVRSRIDKVGAFYLLDEPQFRGATTDEVATAARTIKETFPTIPVMMVEAGPKVTASLQIPTEVDWVGFDWYCQPFSAVQSKLSILNSGTTPTQRLWLMPEAAPLAECGGAPGHQTDAEIAKLQFDYLRLAESNPRVIGLLAFGFWTSGHSSGDLPLTVAAHKQIAARVIRPPAPPSPGPSPQPQPQPPAPVPPAPPKKVAKLRTHRATLGARGLVRLAIGCSRSAATKCTGTLALKTRTGGRLLARRHFAIARGKGKRVALRIRRPMRARALRAAHRRRGYRVIAIVRTPQGTAHAGITLRRPR